jgi:hypothetical protein
MSDIHITIEGGTSKRLLVAGTMPRKNIVITATGGGAAATAPGLYDADDTLLASWDTLKNTYGMDVEKDYYYSSDPNNPGYGDGHPQSIININFYFDAKKLVIPNTVKKIGAYTFANNRLTDVTIPDSVTEIGEWAFQGGDLTSVSLPKGLTSLGEYAFANCAELEKVSIPESLTTIPAHAFRACTYLTSVAIPDSVIEIGQMAFANCSLLSILLPSKLEKIGEEAFSGNLMSSVTIPASVTDYGDGAFANCHNLTDIFVAKGNEYYSNESFIADDGYVHKYIVDTSFFDLVQFPGGITSSFEVPIWITKIHPLAFMGSFVGKVTLPDSLENIGVSAFRGAVNLNILEIPKSVVEIGAWAFSGCSNLVGTWNEDVGNFMLKISSSLDALAENMFLGCTGLLHIYVEDGTLQIDSNAFLKCPNLISISIPDTIQTIGDAIVEAVNDSFEVFFRGAEEAWNNITKGIDNESWLGRVICLE